MNRSIVALSDLSGRPGRRVLGLMSGTSMDGLDMALCSVQSSGMETRVEVEQFASPEFKGEIRQAFRDLAFRSDAGLGDVLTFNTRLSRAWAGLVKMQLGKWDCRPVDIDLIASHGQTLFHQPGANGEAGATFQLVDGDYLAMETGIITISDFRQKHIAAGYDGAPLAPFADLYLFSDPKESRVLLNLGGIANFTFLPGGASGETLPFATDTGPANTLLDEAARRLLPGLNMDLDGGVARRGRVYEPLLNKLLSHPFFSRDFPKSTGQEIFNWAWVQKEIFVTNPDMDIHDLMATLTELTAMTVSEAIRKNVTTGDVHIYVSGGGSHNRFHMERLAGCLPGFSIENISELGVSSDAKEAVLFAVLANEAVAGRGWKSIRGERFTLGKVSFPNIE